MQNIRPNRDVKTAVATLEGRSRKKKRNIRRNVHETVKLANAADTKYLHSTKLFDNLTSNWNLVLSNLYKCIYLREF